MKKPTQIRLTVEASARELGRSATTIAKMLVASGVKPGADGKFTLRQVCDAAFGSQHTERLRETKARADLAEARTAILQKRWLPVDAVERAWANVMRITRQRLLDVPGIVAGSEVKLSERIRKEIHSACEELAQMPPEKFYETETEKMDDENDTEE